MCSFICAIAASVHHYIKTHILSPHFFWNMYIPCDHLVQMYKSHLFASYFLNVLMMSMAGADIQHNSNIKLTMTYSVSIAQVCIPYVVSINGICLPYACIE